MLTVIFRDYFFYQCRHAVGYLGQPNQPQGTFVFYLSGHGILRDDQSFLLATNSVITTPNTLEISAY